MNWSFTPENNFKMQFAAITMRSGFLDEKAKNFLKAQHFDGLPTDFGTKIKQAKVRDEKFHQIYMIIDGGQMKYVKIR